VAPRPAARVDSALAATGPSSCAERRTRHDLPAPRSVQHVRAGGRAGHERPRSPYETGTGDDVDIAIANGDGTNATPALIARAGADRDPAISYDGKQLAFTSTRDGNEEIYRSELDGTAQTNLNARPGARQRP
jgi:hypothetical protein